ncbi:hypothetical protein BGX23_007162 [Mortierella sp. AD031]|nr:hypothetical protein BGX23_007162 [Mortierella sp. AD031]
MTSFTIGTIILVLLSCVLSTVSSSSFVITEHLERNVKCFQSYSDVGLVERSICWHDKEFYADRWHDWPCEIDCDTNVAVRIYLEDYTFPAQREQVEQDGGSASRYPFFGQRALTRTGKGDRRSIFKIYIHRLDSEWQLVTYLHKGTGDCKNEHDEVGWTTWACAEIKTI